MAEKLKLLRERYWLQVGPLLLVFAVALGHSRTLAFVAALLLGLLTLNKLVEAWQSGETAEPS